MGIIDLALAQTSKSSSGRTQRTKTNQRSQRRAVVDTRREDQTESADSQDFGGSVYSVGLGILKLDKDRPGSGIDTIRYRHSGVNAVIPG